jgi:hypothetical protein
MTDANQRPAPRPSVHEFLLSQGYRLVDDAWTEHGRRTYLHDDSLSRGYMASIVKMLTGHGWERHGRKMREFIHSASGDIIEFEPGGSETDGHLVHYMNSIASD